VLIDEMSNLSLIESAVPYTYRTEWTGFHFMDDTLSNDLDLTKVKHK
jgi:hypothetical protein